MRIGWSDEKNAILRRQYGFGFERIVLALSQECLLDERAHPNAERYPHQRQWIVDLDGYAWVVPFVDRPDGVFLKTMYPSRKATREYLESRK
ncbi:toxin [Jiella endophytica]|uniref:Toxin n=1 Tax=Jiella endophytica TaxID=2558362 RepID=A0A4Y8RB91_9HYPH|nr:toxin [Jiella endophytica]TFF18399.1 toxin [Jiella endophytica]